MLNAMLRPLHTSLAYLIMWSLALSSLSLQGYGHESTSTMASSQSRTFTQLQIDDGRDDLGGGFGFDAEFSGDAL